MMNAEDKYKVVIVDDERTAIDALRRELGAYQEFEIKGTANNGAKGKKDDNGTPSGSVVSGCGTSGCAGA